MDRMSLGQMHSHGQDEFRIDAVTWTGEIQSHATCLQLESCYIESHSEL